MLTRSWWCSTRKSGARSAAETLTPVHVAPPRAREGWGYSEEAACDCNTASYLTTPPFRPCPSVAPWAAGTLYSPSSCPLPVLPPTVHPSLCRGRVPCSVWPLLSLLMRWSTIEYSERGMLVEAAPSAGLSSVSVTGDAGSPSSMTSACKVQPCLSATYSQKSRVCHAHASPRACTCTQAHAGHGVDASLLLLPSTPTPSQRRRFPTPPSGHSHSQPASTLPYLPLAPLSHLTLAVALEQTPG